MAGATWTGGLDAMSQNKVSGQQCSTCGVNNRIGAKYCKHCGRLLIKFLGGAPPLIVREIKEIARCSNFEPCFIWLPGRNLIAFTEVCSLPHHQNCTARNETEGPPPVQELTYFRRYCDRCNVFLTSVGLYLLDVETKDKALLAICLTSNTRLDATKDGQRVAFTSANDQKIWELVVDTRQVTRLTNGDGEHICPQYMEKGVLTYLHVSKTAPPFGPIEGEIRFHDLATSQLLNSVPYQLTIFSSDITRRYFAIASMNLSEPVKILNVRDRFCSIKEVSIGAFFSGWGSVSRLVLSPDGKTLTVGYFTDDFLPRKDVVGDLGAGNDHITIDLTTGTSSTAISAMATWTPDAQFVADPRSGIFRYTGRGFDPLILGPQFGHTLHWSPNGQKLLAEGYAQQIWAVNLDGEELQYLTEGYDPQWSFDSRHIAFLRSAQQEAYELYLIRVEPK